MADPQPVSVPAVSGLSAKEASATELTFTVKDGSTPSVSADKKLTLEIK